MAQPFPQVSEYLIRDVNPKWFHCNNPISAIASGQLNAQAISQEPRLLSPGHSAFLGGLQYFGRFAHLHIVAVEVSHRWDEKVDPRSRIALSYR
jgi:hypothetical protein